MTGPVLLLQGPASGFWRDVAAAFEARGRRVLHVTLALGDWAFWRRGSIPYRGRLAAWEGWLAGLVEREGVSDILYFGDRRPYHVAAARVAEQLGRRAWAVENGYLRPDWLTLEPVAMGRFSRFSRDPATIRALAEGQPPAPVEPAFPVAFRTLALNQAAMALAHLAGRPAFPAYRGDRPVPPLIEAAGWVRRPALAGTDRRRAEGAVGAMEAARAAGGPPTVALALQLEADYQLRASSDFAGQTEMLESVVASMARHAPPDLRLLVKVHPHDSGLIDWRARLERIVGRHGVAARVGTIRGGSLQRFLAASRGLVTINSTTGVHALRLGRPVITLGDAVYDMPGLTHRSGLARFWTVPEPPDPGLVDAWCRAAAAEIQLRGSLLHREGRRIAATEIARRVSDPGRYWRLHRPAPGASAAAAEPCARRTDHPPVASPCADWCADALRPPRPGCDTGRERERQEPCRCPSGTSTVSSPPVPSP